MNAYSKDKRRKELATITRYIHSLIRNINPPTDSVGSYELRHGFVSGKKIRRLIVYLRSTGCQWIFDDEKGGCFMCGHLAGTTQGVSIKYPDYIKQFGSIINQFDFADIPMLCVYNAGSFFNNNEVPKQAREHIYKIINSITGVKHVIFESRPEYITDSELELICRNIDKSIEIGFGLESSNEYIRQVCLNKGYGLGELITAIEKCRKFNVITLAYVLLKPPFLSEANAIKDAVDSIRWAFEHNVDVVSLEPVSVQVGTLVHLLYRMKSFRPPWIWSVLKTVIDCNTNKLIRIGGFEFFPPPFIYAHNCEFCNKICIDAIEKYNKTNDVNVLKQIFDIGCDKCKQRWQRTLNVQSSIVNNIDIFLSKMDRDIVGQYIEADLAR